MLTSLVGPQPLMVRFRLSVNKKTTYVIGKLHGEQGLIHEHMGNPTLDHPIWNTRLRSKRTSPPSTYTLMQLHQHRKAQQFCNNPLAAIFQSKHLRSPSPLTKLGLGEAGAPQLPVRPRSGDRSTPQCGCQWEIVFWANEQYQVHGNSVDLMRVVGYLVMKL